VLGRRLFLLPPRERPIALIARDGARAAVAAGELAQRGWANVSWLDGSLDRLPRRRMRSGRAPNRTWEPAPLLREFLHLLPRDGEAVDLACGSGREAVYLALHGRRVLGVDRLPDALLQARVLARESALPRGRLSLRRVDLTDSAATARLLRPRRFRVILCFRYLDRALLPLIAASLAPGGVLVYQTFLEAQARAGRRPSRAAFLLKPGEIRRTFSGLEMLHCTEGPDARGDHLASLVARKPAGDGDREDPPHALRRA
jgi:SAM-dependent methyltransferase